MIGSLRGTVIDREVSIDRSSQPEVVIEVTGVGYRVTVTPATLDRLDGDGEVLVFIHHHIGEANQRLFGFAAKEERVAFEGLVAARGVGPTMAMAILATHDPSSLARILADDDLAALCEVPGVGKKTAQRLLVELKSTLVLPVIDLADGVAPVAPSTTDRPLPLTDLREALANLGYSADEVKAALAQLPPDELGSPDADTGQLLRAALQAMAKS